MDEFRKLVKPVTEDGREIREVTMRRPIVNDFLLLEQKNIKGQTARDVDMVSRLTGLLPTTVSQLDMRDYVWLSRKMQSFFEDDGSTEIAPL